ncbi:hypothetical protein ACJX0J_019158, partial [Zea mays]
MDGMKNEVIKEMANDVPLHLSKEANLETALAISLLPLSGYDLILGMDYGLAISKLSDHYQHMFLWRLCNRYPIPIFDKITDEVSPDSYQGMNLKLLSKHIMDILNIDTFIEEILHQVHFLVTKIFGTHYSPRVACTR